MKLELVVDLEVTRRAKRTIAGLVGVAMLLGGAAIAWANLPTVWNDGDTLTAAALNGNFAVLDANFTALDERVTVLEAAPAVITASSPEAEASPGTSQNTIYTHADLVLPAGTWLVQGYATLNIEVADDSTGLGLYDATASASIAGSVGGIEALFVGATDGAFQTAQTIVTVAGSTTIRLEAWRNGASQVSFSPFTGSLIGLTGPHKLVAVRLR